MSSFKKLKSSDVTLSPYIANKQWSVNQCYPSSGSYFTIYKGTNLTSSFNSFTDPVTEEQYERLVYDSINHLFYQSYNGDTLNTQSLSVSLFYESSSEQRPTNSYFVYNENPAFITNYPSGANAGIRVLTINQDIYGSQILPYNFKLSSSAYYVKDDGNGNLYDIASEPVHIGNVFYPQGISVITNPDYQLMFPLPPLANNDYYIYKLSDPDKPIYPLDNDIARSGVLDPSTIILSGSQSSNFNINLNGTGSVTASAIGAYEVYYTVEADLNNGCDNLISNKAKILVNIISDDIPLTTTTTSAPTTTTTTAPTTTTTTATPTTTTTAAPTTTTTTATPTTTTTTTEVPTTTTTTASPGYEYRLFGYATNTSDACSQTGTYVDLGTLTVYAASSTLSDVTLFYNNTTPLANPYINASIGNGDRVLFALASDVTEKWTGTYNNTTGAISSNSDCTP